MQAVNVQNVCITFFDRGRVYPYNDYNDMENIKITKIIKTGTSLCVVIPKSIRHALNFERGDQVVFGILDDQSLVIRKLSYEDLIKLKQ